MSWEDCGITDSLKRVVEDHLKLPTPTAIQSACLTAIATPTTDYLVQAPTGSGKTLACLLPVLRHSLTVTATACTATACIDTACTDTDTSKNNNNNRRAIVGSTVIVLSPTRELAHQTHGLVETILAKVKPHWMTSVLLCGSSTAGSHGKQSETNNHSTVSPQARKKEKEALRKGQTVVVGTPGRILDHLENSQGWRRDRLQWLVLDEADRLLDSGFAPKVKQIVDLIGGGKVSVLYCSATCSHIDKTFLQLRADSKIVKAADGVGDGDMPAFLCQEAVVCPTKQRLAVLVGLLKTFLRTTANNGRAVVFMSNCDSVDFHYALFSKRAVVPDVNIPAVCKLHGNLEQQERQQQLQRFASEPCAVMFVTDVAARGLNLATSSGTTTGNDNNNNASTNGVQLIIQYDAPCDRLDYVHRAGRTARGIGAHGRSVLMLMDHEAEYLVMLREQHQLDISVLSFTDVCGWLGSKCATDSTITSASSTGNGASSTSSTGSSTRETKSRFGLWLKRLCENMANHDKKATTGPLLKDLAKRAYSSTIRAYATHPSDERHIFHIKRLHLGHLAASFGLDEEAASSASASASGKTSGKNNMKTNGKTDDKNKRKNGDKTTHMPVKKAKRSVSEFSAY